MQTLFTALGGNTNLLDSEGLAANRLGEITEAQHQRLNVALGWGQGCGLLVVLPVILVMGAGLMIMVLTLGSSWSTLIPLFMMLVFFLLAAVTFVPNIWRIASNSIKLKRDRENRAIRQAQGQLALALVHKT